MENKKYNEEFETIVGDILTHSEFLKLKLIEHHGNGLYEHSVAVGYHSFRVAKTLGMDYASVARGALLHDFFMESWQGQKKDSKGIQRIKDMHGFSHPKTALINAEKYFDIDERQADMIVKHMFPLTPIPPMNMGSWVVTAVDKFVAIREIVFERSRPMRRLKGFLLKA
ncbi:HDIG domain-containing metalloprotein [Acetobacterium bakii]|uniref:Phosphohydrolase n=1 Tax=Acetobacterium bakii TaxID=52689 RepID=A0A0L6U354_9FIRM|nr:HDIG domain-containing metalloprotein [Acetobacterium bakii]KNZ42939.1 phosphohydrolase [Acetobacterium bakii]